MSLGLGTLVLDSSTRNVHAEETEVNVNVPVTLAITSHTPTVNIDASNPNQFYTGTASIVSTANNPTGYTLTMADKDTNTDLVNPDYDSSTTPASFAGTIGSITSPITVDGTGSNFTVNKWGYAKESATTTFLPIPASTAAEEVKKTDAPAETSTATVTFGTKINKDLVGGEYLDTVVFSLTANAVVRDITKATSMQDLAAHPEYCTASTVGQSKSLPDTRNNQSYTIRKLADGKCWMVNNLKLLGGSWTLDSTTTDHPVNGFSLPSAVEPSQRDYDTPYVYANAEGYDGYLYNWNAATAGNGTTSVTGGDVGGSICPAGWTLPTRNDFVVMAGEYGNSGDASAWSAALRNTEGPSFTLAGGWDNGLFSQGYNGYYWSRTAYDEYDTDSIFAQYLFFDEYGVNPENYDAKYYGFSVRCLLVQ